MNTSLKKYLPLIVILLVAAVLVVITVADFGGDSNNRVTTSKTTTTTTNNTKPDKPLDYGDGDKGFIDGIGGVSDTYEGTVSTESYSSAKAAAEAFVNKEVAGNDDVAVLNTKSKGTYEVDKVDIAIPSDLLNGADGVEKLEVTYKITASETSKGNGYASAMSNRSNEGETQTIVVYVIKFGTNYKYYTPMPITGETITKSYYDSVFDAEKYKNCTFTALAEITADVDMSYQGEVAVMEMTITLEQVIKHDDGRVYMYQKMTTDTQMNAMGDVENESFVEEIYAYMETVNGRPVCYVKMSDDDEWTKADLHTIGFSSIEELTPFYDQYLDFSYFKKTNYGFSLEDENARQYFNQVFSEIMGDVGIDFDEDADFEMTAKYYVNDGVLSGIQTDAVIRMSIVESGILMNITEIITGTTTCTDYGTTEVVRPDVD